MKMKIIITSIVVLLCLMIQVMPIFALSENQLFYDINNKSLLSYVDEKTDSEIYKVVWQSNNIYYLLMSSKPITIYDDGINYKFEVYQTNSNICFYAFNPINNTKWIYQSVAWGANSQYLYGQYLKSTTILLDKNNVQNSLIKYSTHDIWNKANTLCYYLQSENQFTSDGFQLSISNLLEGQLFPSVYNAFDNNSNINVLEYPWHVVYKESTDDDKVKFLASRVKLTLRPPGDDYQFYGISSSPNKILKFTQDDDEWVNMQELTPMSDIGHLDLLPDDILYSNYDIYTPDNLTRVFDNADSSNGAGGFDDEHLTDDRSILEKMQDFFSDLTDLPAFLLGLFIPTVDDTQDHISNYKDQIAEKLGYQDFITALTVLKDQDEVEVSNSESNLSGTLYGNIPVNVKLFDTSIFDTYKSTIHEFLYAIVGLSLIIYNINQFYKLLNSGGTITDGSYTIGRALDRTDRWRKKGAKS